MRGVVTALITPFDGEKLDMDGWCRNLERQVRAGVSGVVVAGTTGESPTLTTDETDTLVREAVAGAGDCPVIVGVGTNSTSSTVERTRAAEALGAKGLLVVCPYYNKPPQEGLLAHYRQVCAATSLPVYVYHHPGRTGCRMTLETILELAKEPRIMGIKDASGDQAFIEGIIESVLPERPEFF